MTPHEERLAALKARSRVLVETLEFTVFLPEGDDLEHLELRIELFESLEAPGHFSARLWRIEFYRLQSTFPQLPGPDGESTPTHHPSDELILKEFEGFESPLEAPVVFPDRVAARDYVLGKLASWLGTLGWDGATDSGDVS